MGPAEDKVAASNDDKSDEMADQAPDSDAYTSPFQLTKAMHRDVYGRISPSDPSLAATGKVLVLTGATGGVGHKIAQAWSTAACAGIVLFGRQTDDLNSIAASLSVPTLVVAGTTTSITDTASAFTQALAKFGHVDCLINCAGAFAFGGMTGDIDPNVWWRDYEVNVRGTYNMCHHFIKATGGKGTIINLVSIGASFSAPGMSSYATSKLAVIKLGELLEVEHPDLRTFSMHPDIVEATEDRGMMLAPFTPFAKDKPQLAAALTLYLNTPRADLLKGGFVSVNWDVDEMEAHQGEIVGKNLVKLGFLNGKLGVGGVEWEG